MDSPDKNKLSYATDPEDIIIGVWDGLKPNNEGAIWTFKSNGTMKKTDSSVYVPYELVNGASLTQCPDKGMTSTSRVYNSEQLVLIIETSNEDNDCYIIDYLDYKQELEKTLMSLWYAPNGNHLAFEKRE